MIRGNKQWLGKTGAVVLLSATLLWTTAPFQAFAANTGSSTTTGTGTGTSPSEPQINYSEGKGQVVKLDRNIASFKLKTGYVFLDGTNTKNYESTNNETPTGQEIGAVIPRGDNEHWELYFEYDEPGHIEDSEKDDIDADALLDGYKKNTEESNKTRLDNDKLYVDGWDTPPHYDEKTHNLSWCLLGHNSKNKKLVNYNVRILTREGYISVILVSNPESLAKSRQTMENTILNTFQVTSGQKYEDFNKSTDKSSKYGLTGLILGGAGLVVAKKTGLLAMLLLVLKKGAIFIVAGLAGLWRFLTGKGKKQKTNNDQTPGEPPYGENPPTNPPTM